MKKLLFMTLLALVSLATSAQQIKLTFAGKNSNNYYIKQDSIRVTNQDRGWTLVLYNPDTVLILTSTTGIRNQEDLFGEYVGQNFPNPFEGVTNVTLNVPEKQSVRVSVYDINGREVMSDKRTLDQGSWNLQLSLAVPQTYILNVKMKDHSSSVKMVNVGRAGSNSLSYSGIGKAMVKGTCLETRKPFAKGDCLYVVGYTTYQGGVFTSSAQINPEASQRVTLAYALTTPRAPWMITVPYFHLTDTSFYSGGLVKSENGAPVTECGVCWDTMRGPSIANAHVAGQLEDKVFISFISGLTPNTTYYYRCYGKNKYGIAYGAELSFRTNEEGSVAPSCPDVPTVTDVDGNVYHTVQIGTQCWLKESMRTLHYADGTPIPAGSVQKESYTAPYWYYPLGNAEHAESLGLIYNYSAMMGTGKYQESQGICPDGWHVPTDAEWAVFTDTVLACEDYEYARYFCNDNSFDLMSTGYYYDHTYLATGFLVMMWSSTLYNETSAWMRAFSPETKAITRYGFKNCSALSVRCIKNE